MKRTLTLLILLLAIVAAGRAQSERRSDFGTIAGAEVEVGLGDGFGLAVEEELRFDNNSTQLDRWLNGVSLDYAFLHKRMKASVGVDYIRRHNDKGYYENRGRLAGQLTYTESVHYFKLSLRTKLVATYFDEQTGDHRVDPKLYWRNRFQVTYQVPKSRFKYALSTELFWLVNDPKNCIVDNLRTTASVDYRVARHNTLSAFFRMENELQVSKPVDRFYVGLSYKLKL